MVCKRGLYPAPTIYSAYCVSSPSPLFLPCGASTACASGFWLRLLMFLRFRFRYVVFASGRSLSDFRTTISQQFHRLAPDSFNVCDLLPSRKRPGIDQSPRSVMIQHRQLLKFFKGRFIEIDVLEVFSFRHRRGSPPFLAAICGPRYH